MTQHRPPRFREEISVLEGDVQKRPDAVNALGTHLLHGVEQSKLGEAVHESLPRDATLPLPSRPTGAESSEADAEAAALDAQGDHLVFDRVLLFGYALYLLQVVHVLQHLLRATKRIR